MPDEPEFHDIVFVVDKIERGQIFRRQDQRLTARASVVLSKEQVDVLFDILSEYRKNYQPGVGPLTWTGIGHFR